MRRPRDNKAMRRFTVLLASLALPSLAFAQGYTFAGQTGTAQLYNGAAPAEPQVPRLYAAWKAERDSARRAEIGRDLVDAIIHELDLPQLTIADEVAEARLTAKREAARAEAALADAEAAQRKTKEGRQAADLRALALTQTLDELTRKLDTLSATLSGREAAE